MNPFTWHKALSKALHWDALASCTSTNTTLGQWFWRFGGWPGHVVGISRVWQMGTSAPGASWRRVLSSSIWRGDWDGTILHGTPGDSWTLLGRGVAALVTLKPPFGSEVEPFQCVCVCGMQMWGWCSDTGMRQWTHLVISFEFYKCSCSQKTYKKKNQSQQEAKLMLLVDVLHFFWVVDYWEAAYTVSSRPGVSKLFSQRVTSNIWHSVELEKYIHLQCR